MRRYLRLTTIALAVAATGCVDVEEAITLQPNMSGEARFTVKADLEPIIESLANTAHHLSGGGNATPAEIDTVRREMLAESKNEMHAPSVEELARTMPPGIDVLESHAESQGTKMSGTVRFHFANLAALGQIVLPKSGNGTGALDRPFDRLQVRDEGTSWVLTLPPTDPLGTGAASPGPTGKSSPPLPTSTSGPQSVAAMNLAPLADTFKDLKFSFRLETPLEVLETNATRRDGNALIWEFNFAQLAEISQHNDGRAIFARLRKPS
jgi:hypothetical protein